jgi:hypothetical protein
MPSADAPLPPELGAQGRILEGIVTTRNLDGTPNISPMGPLVDDRVEWLWLRPFRTSTTFQNLDRDAQGVFHVTDDVLLLAQAAIGRPKPLPELRPAAKVEGVVLTNACRWFEFRIERIEARAERPVVLARVVHRGIEREFFGFNRAKHAVVEAAILATRVHLLPQDEIMAEFARLAAPVAKTGAAAEREAFDLLRRYVAAESRS